MTPRADNAAYLREWRATSQAYKKWSLRNSRRRNAKYQDDPEYREKVKARQRAYYWQKKEQEK